ncbi:hypothetical protein V8C35DRAFT_317526 [Trichoderma chlorosporum]
MALMVASAALSGVGNFVFEQSSRLHTACSKFLFDYEAQNSEDGVSRKRRRVQHQTSTGTMTSEAPRNIDQSSQTTTPMRELDTEAPTTPMIELDTEPPRHTQQPSQVVTHVFREPNSEVDNTSAIYQNREIRADVAEYVDREDSNYKIASAVSNNNDQEEDSDFLDYLEMESSRQYIEPTTSANNNQQMASDVAAYLAMDDSDQDMEPTTSAHNSRQVASNATSYLSMDDSVQVMEPTNSAYNRRQVSADMAAYLATLDSDQDMEPITSAKDNKQMMSDLAAYIAKDDSLSSGTDSVVTVIKSVRFAEPEVREPEREEPEGEEFERREFERREEDEWWMQPLVYNKKQPGPSPSVSSVGDIFEELGISPLDLNDGFEDDEPKITWIEADTEEEFEEILRRRRAARAGKQPAGEPAPQLNPARRIDELMALPSVETLKISDESKAEVESMQVKAAEIRLVDQQRAKLDRERLMRDQILQKLKERTSKGPRQPMVAPLSNEWIEKIQNMIELPDAEVVATTCQGTPLRRHDFASVVAAKTWLNDEIVNGALAELEKQINLVAGITDYKQQGRKCLVMNSFFWPRVKEAGGKKTQSILRRMGVTPKNLLLMDTILIPICQDYHWTLLVVQPKQRKVMHLDSFNRRSPHPDLALAWMSDYLGDLYHTRPWQVAVMKTPQQTNGYDCGVHVITNGICLALGVEPLQCYDVEQMSLQRLRIAGMLMNGGFEGDFDLWQQ